MSQSDNSFDKNLRSLLDAISMFEKEARLLLERFGLDSDGIARVMDLVGSLSSEAVRPIAAAVGIADAATVESLARDVRALLQSEARMRREQAQSAARLDDVLAAVEALGATTARLADLQSRTHERLDALAERATVMDAAAQSRERLADEITALRSRIDGLEAALAADAGAEPLEPAEGEEAGPPPGIKPGARRIAPRTVSAGAGTHKILESLPTLEPKVRPA